MKDFQIAAHIVACMGDGWVYELDLVKRLRRDPECARGWDRSIDVLSYLVVGRAVEAITVDGIYNLRLAPDYRFRT